jgi:hypothetical protein
VVDSVTVETQGAWSVMRRSVRAQRRLDALGFVAASRAAWSAQRSTTRSQNRAWLLMSAGGSHLAQLSSDVIHCPGSGYEYQAVSTA